MPNPNRFHLPTEVKAAMRKAGHIVASAAGEITDSLGRKWNPALHPRDSQGRFIETGGIATVAAKGLRGRVTRSLGNGRVEITTPDGKKHREMAAAITMVKRPDGSAPVKAPDDDDHSLGAQKARKLIAEQDAKRDADPNRGDGVTADDDGDGVPNDVDADPKDPTNTARVPSRAAAAEKEPAEKKPSTRAARTAKGRDVGDGYKMVDNKPKDSLSADTDHELYDDEGRLVGVMTRTTTGFKGNIRGRNVAAKNEEGWLAQAKLLHGAHRKANASQSPTPSKGKLTPNDVVIAPTGQVRIGRGFADRNGGNTAPIGRIGRDKDRRNVWKSRTADGTIAEHKTKDEAVAAVVAHHNGEKPAAAKAPAAPKAPAARKPAAATPDEPNVLNDHQAKRDAVIDRAGAAYDKWVAEHGQDDATRRLGSREGMVANHLKAEGLADAREQRMARDNERDLKGRDKQSAAEHRERLVEGDRERAAEQARQRDEERAAAEQRAADAEQRARDAETLATERRIAALKERERAANDRAEAAEEQADTAEREDTGQQDLFGTPDPTPTPSKEQDSERAAERADEPELRGDRREAPEGDRSVVEDDRGGSDGARDAAGRRGAGVDQRDAARPDAGAEDGRDAGADGAADRDRALPRAERGDQDVPAAGADDGADGPERGGEAGGGPQDGSEGANRPLTDRFPDAESFEPKSQADLAPKGDKAKAKANIEALRVLRQLQEEDRPATHEEQAILAKWSSWGALGEEMFSDKDTHAKAYADERAAMHELMSEKDIDAARTTTVNAHYTDASMVEAAWTALRDLGFDGDGTVLEPGSGSGNFMGFAPEGAHMVGIEMDPTTAAISRYLYPDATVINSPIEQVDLPKGSFDAAIGNVPFGEMRPFDKVLNSNRKHNLHNLSIIKALDSLREGGLGAFITSSYTMDSENAASSRRAMYDRADLVAAIRMPNNAHADSAGTAVLTDLLIFRKREDGAPKGDRTWVDGARGPEQTLGEYMDDGVVKHVTVNPYWNQHPGSVLGEMGVARDLGTGGLRADSEVAVLGVTRNVGPQITSAFRKVRSTDVPSYKPRGEGEDRFDIGHHLDGIDGRSEGSLVQREDGSIGIIRGGRVEESKVPKTQQARVKKLMAMRDLASKLLTLERSTDESDNRESDRLRKELNKLYDGYVSRNKGEDYPDGGAPINDSKWAKSVSDKNLDEPKFRVPTAELEQGDIVTWRGTNAKGKPRRAVVTEVDPENGVIKVSVMGAVKTGANKEQAEFDLDPNMGERWDVTGHRTTNHYRKRVLPPSFEADPLSGLVVGLESYDPETNTAVKGSLLRERTLVAAREMTNVEDPETALSMVVDRDGKFDLPTVAKVMGKDEATTRRQLTGLVFDDPDNEGNLITREEYLSGHIREKLRAAEAAARNDEKFKENVDALTEVLPEWHDSDRITAKLGASWVPADTVTQFMRELLDDRKVTATLHGGSTWQITEQGRDSKDAVVGNEWGAGGRNAYELIDSLLNQRRIRITSTIDGKTQFDKESTDAANAKAQEITARFAEWLWEDADRAEQILNDYNDNYNSLVKRSYSDAPMHPEGLSQSFELYPHQASAARRILAEPAVLIAHEVGAGKTLELATAAMELRRRGHAKKPMIVVPNHMKEQWQREFLTAYPQARVLAISGEDVNTPQARRQYLAQVATGDWDAVIITHSTFGSINMTKDAQRDYIEEQLAEMREGLQAAQALAAAKGEKDSKTVKKIEKQILDAKANLEEKLNKQSDSGLTFEQLGVDYLMVDEAHEFKNLRRTSSTDEGIVGSDMASDLDMKLSWMRNTTESGRYVTFATATPVSNSFGEIHTLMKYLRPDLLEKAGVKNFDAFLANFAKMESKYEMSAAGGDFVEKYRIRSYTNAVGLFRQFQQVADVMTAEDLDLDVPDVDGGVPEQVYVPGSDWLAEYTDHLVMRDAAAKANRGKKGQDNILVINSDGSAAALDPRMVGGPKLEVTKITVAADNIAQIVEETKDNVYVDPNTKERHPRPGALQLVFMDMGTPGAQQRYKDKLAKFEEDHEKWERGELIDKKTGEEADEPMPPVGDSAGFEAYEALKEELIARGIPADKIAFMHDAKGNDTKKAKLFAKARSGEISVLVGSTALMGVGTNVQARAVAIHHLDTPYRPSDIQQRDGRIVRQKNQNGTVRVLQYATTGSLDARKWEIQGRKGRIINNLMRGDLSVDQFDEMDPTVFTAEEMSANAANDPVRLQKLQNDASIQQVKNAKRSFEQSQRNAGRIIEGAKMRAHALREKVAALTEAIPKLKRDDEGNFIAKIGAKGETFEKRVDANYALRNLAKKAYELRRGMQGGDPVDLGTIGGFAAQAQAQFDLGRDGTMVMVTFPDLPDTEFKLFPDSIDSTDFIARFDNLLGGLERDLEDAKAELPDVARNAENAKKQLGRTFKDQAKLDALEKRAERYDALVDHLANHKQEPVPASLRRDSPEVDELIGAVDAIGEEKKKVTRKPAASLANITDDGEVVPRTNSHMKRKRERDLNSAAATKAKNRAGGRSSSSDDGPRNPDQGKRIGEPMDRPVGRDGAQIFETVGGRQIGQTSERVLFNVQKDDDGMFGVYGIGEEEPRERFRTLDEARGWALDEAKKGPVATEAKPDPRRNSHGDQSNGNRKGDAGNVAAEPEEERVKVDPAEVEAELASTGADTTVLPDPGEAITDEEAAEFDADVDEAIDAPETDVDAPEAPEAPEAATDAPAAPVDLAEVNTLGYPNHAPEGAQVEPKTVKTGKKAIEELAYERELFEDTRGQARSDADVASAQARLDAYSIDGDQVTITDPWSFGYTLDDAMDRIGDNDVNWTPLEKGNLLRSLQTLAKRAEEMRATHDAPSTPDRGDDTDAPNVPEERVSLDPAEVEADLASTGADTTVLPETPEAFEPDVIPNQGENEGQTGLTGDGFDLTLDEGFLKSEEVNAPAAKPAAAADETDLFAGTGTEAPVAPSARFNLADDLSEGKLSAVLRYAADKTHDDDDRAALSFAAALLGSRSRSGLAKQGADLAKPELWEIAGVDGPGMDARVAAIADLAKELRRRNVAAKVNGTDGRKGTGPGLPDAMDEYVTGYRAARKDAPETLTPEAAPADTTPEAAPAAADGPELQSDGLPKLGRPAKPGESVGGGSWRRIDGEWRNLSKADEEEFQNRLAADRKAKNVEAGKVPLGTAVGNEWDNATRILDNDGVMEGFEPDAQGRRPKYSPDYLRDLAAFLERNPDRDEYVRRAVLGRSALVHGAKTDGHDRVNIPGLDVKVGDLMWTESSAQNGKRGWREVLEVTPDEDGNGAHLATEGLRGKVNRHHIRKGSSAVVQVEKATELDGAVPPDRADVPPTPATPDAPEGRRVTATAKQLSAGDVIDGWGTVLRPGYANSKVTKGRVAVDVRDSNGRETTHEVNPGTKFSAWRPNTPPADAAEWKPTVKDLGPNHQQIVDPASERVLFDVEKHDGVWSVHDPSVQVGVGFKFGSRKDAMAWANKYADLQRDRKELPDEEGNFFDDAPETGALVDDVPDTGAPMLDADGRPTEAARQRFTAADCWQLAKAMHDETGWPMVAVGYENDEGGVGWAHVAVRRPDGFLIDVEGEHGEGDLLDTYGPIVEADGPDIEADIIDIPNGRFREMLGEDPTQAVDDEVRSVAKAVIDRHRGEDDEQQTQADEAALDAATGGNGDGDDTTPPAPSTPDEPEEQPATSDDVPDPAEEAAGATDGDSPTPAMLPGEKFPPSQQQQAVYDAVLDSKDVKVQAKAGAGKTSTLEGLARRIGEQDPKARIVYIAFNKSVQIEAEGRMPSNVEARTGHSIAWRWAPENITAKFGKRGMLRRPDAIAKHLGLRDDDNGLSAQEKAMAVVKTVDRYATSADDTISSKHLPERFQNLTLDEQGELVMAAENAWGDLKSPTGQMRLTQDHIRKMWALSKPDLGNASSGLKRGATTLFLDEAQDTPPVLAKVVADQKMRKVIVGDADQAIYGFTGAIDYLDKADADVELPLTKSYRFGPAVADAGNRFLQLLDSKTRVIGGGPESTIEEDMDAPDAVLVRSNGGMLDEIARELEAGRKVAVTKGTKQDLLSLVDSADYLTGRGSAPERMHEDLEPFSTWAEVVKEAQKGDDQKLAMLERMVREKGTDGIRDLVEQVTELGGDLLEGVEVQQDDTSLSLSGNTFELNKRLKADTGSGLGQFGFRWNAPGAPEKSWTVKGDQAKRTRALEQVREFAAPGTDADVTISTAHKAKGLEWDRVRIGSDFRGPKENPDTGELMFPAPEELRLNYVAVTRAKTALDPGSLGWVYDHTNDNGEKPALGKIVEKAPEPERVTLDPAEVEADLASTGADTSVLPEVPEVAPQADTNAPDVAPEADAPAAADSAPVDLGDGYTMKLGKDEDGTEFADILDPDGALIDTMEAYEGGDGITRWPGNGPRGVDKDPAEAAQSIVGDDKHRRAVADSPESMAKVNVEEFDGPDLRTTEGAPKAKVVDGRTQISDGTTGFGYSKGEHGMQRSWEQVDGEWIDKGNATSMSRGFLLTDYLNARAKRDALARFPADEDLPEKQWIERGGARAYRDGDATLVMFPRRLGDTDEYEDWWDGEVINRLAPDLPENERNGYSLRGWEPGGQWPAGNGSGQEAAMFLERIAPQQAAVAEAWKKHGEALHRLNFKGGRSDSRKHVSELAAEAEVLEDAAAILRDAPDTMLAQHVDGSFGRLRTLRGEIARRDADHITAVDRDELTRRYNEEVDSLKERDLVTSSALQDIEHEMERRDKGGVSGPADATPAPEPEATPEVAPEAPAADVTPEAPEAPAEKPLREMSLEELDAFYLNAADTPDGIDPALEDRIDYEMERRRYVDPAFVQGQSDDDLGRMYARAAANDDAEIVRNIHAEFEARDAAGVKYGKGGRPVDTTPGDNGFGDGPSELGKRTLAGEAEPTTKKARREQAIRDVRMHNETILDKHWRASDNGGRREGANGGVQVGAGVELLTGLSEKHRNQLLDGKGVPGNVIAKNMEEEGTLALWGMTPAEIREYGMTTLRVPGTIDRDDFIADRENGGTGFGDDGHDDAYGAGGVDAEDLTADELDSSVEAAHDRGDEEGVLDLELERADRAQQSDEDREAAELDRKKRRADADAGAEATDPARDMEDDQLDAAAKDGDDAALQEQRRRAALSEEQRKKEAARRRRRRRNRGRRGQRAGGGRNGGGMGGPGLPGGMGLPGLPGLPKGKGDGAGGRGKKGRSGKDAVKPEGDDTRGKDLPEVEEALVEADAAGVPAQEAANVPSRDKDGADLTPAEVAEETRVADEALGDPAPGIEEHIAAEDLPEGGTPGTGTVGGKTFSQRRGDALADTEKAFDLIAGDVPARKRSRKIRSAADLRGLVGDAVAEHLLLGGHVDADSLRGKVSAADLKDLFGVEGLKKGQVARWVGAPDAANRARRDLDGKHAKGGSLPGADDRRKAAMDAGKGDWSAPVDPRDMKRGDVVLHEDPVSKVVSAALVSDVRPVMRYGSPGARIETDRGDMWVPADDARPIHRTLSGKPSVKGMDADGRAELDAKAAEALAGIRADRVRYAEPFEVENGFAQSGLPAGDIPVGPDGLSFQTMSALVRGKRGDDDQGNLVSLAMADGDPIVGYAEQFSGGDMQGTITPRMLVRLADGTGVWVEPGDVRSARIIEGDAIVPGAGVPAASVPDGARVFRRRFTPGGSQQPWWSELPVHRADDGTLSWGTGSDTIDPSEVVYPAVRIDPTDTPRVDAPELDAATSERGHLPDGDGHIIEDVPETPEAPVEEAPEAPAVPEEPTAPEAPAAAATAVDAPEAPEADTTPARPQAPAVDRDSVDEPDTAAPDAAEPTPEPEPEPARMPDWVTVDSLQIGDYARVQGITSTGEPFTGAGWLVNDPHRVSWQPADGSAAVDMVAITTDERIDGPGSSTVYATPESLAALAPRMDSDEVVDKGGQLAQAKIDVRDGRMPDRIPTDSRGELALFPGSRVADVDGQREGVVIGSRAQDVTVRWDSDDVEDVTGTNLRVTDDGIARPDGWTRDGARIPDVDDLEPNVKPTATTNNVPDQRPLPGVDADLDAEAEALAIDILQSVQGELPGLDVLSGMTPAQVEKLVKKAAEKAMRESAGRRRELAQRMVATQPYQPGLFTTVMALLLGLIGFIAIAVIKAILWMLKRGNREMAKDKLRSIARAAGTRAPEYEKLLTLLGQVTLG